MKKCPICNSNNYNRITEREGVSPFSNKLFSNKELAKNVSRCNLIMNLCLNCGFIYNEEFDESVDLYDKEYNNSQNASKLFDSYINSSVEYVMKNYLNNQTAKIVEIGCGRDATYLSKCCEYVGLNNRNIEFIGYDPSCICSEEKNTDNFRLFPEYYDLSTNEKLDADILISRHVIEHIANPLDLLESLTSLNKKNPKAISYIETPDVTWILKNNVIFDFPYEHCSLFSPISLKNAMKRLDLSLKELKFTFGNQYMCGYFGHNNIIDDNDQSLDELIEVAEKYSKNEKNIVAYVDSLISSFGKKGKVALWGAGAKGNTILNLLDKDENRIDCVIDINKDKWNKFISGTGHKIISPEDIMAHNIDTVFVMNRNYYNEVKEVLGNLNYNINCVNLDMELQKAIP